MLLSLIKIMSKLKKTTIASLSEFVLFFEDDFKETKYRNLLLRKIGFKIGNNVIIDRNLKFYDAKSIIIGNNVLIRQDCFLDHDISINDSTIISMNVKVITAGHIPGTMEYVSKPVSIGKNVWIGANATILPGVTLEDNSCVAAGAIVTKNVSSNTLVGGIPAKFIKSI